MSNSKHYAYPNGYMSPIRPSDGQIFNLNGTNGVEVWQWDDFKENWFLIEKHYDTDHRQESKDKCECGAESIGSAMHSDWCKKYRKEN